MHACIAGRVLESPPMDLYRFTLSDGRVATFAPIRQTVSVEGASTPIELGNAESRLLHLLLESPGKVHGRDEIMARVWSDRVVAPGSLNQSVFTLRNALGDGRAHELIKTVPRRGYTFDAAHVLGDAAPVAAPATPSVAAVPITNATAPVAPAVAAGEPAQPTPRRRLPRRWLVAFYALLFVLAAWLVSENDVIVSSLTHGVAVESQRHGHVEWRFVDDDAAGARQLRERMAPVVRSVSADRRGVVWVNRMFRMYDLSCVRSDDSTMEVVANRDSLARGDLAPLVDDCLQVAR